MKRLILSVALGLMALTATQAQSYRSSKYYNPQTGRLDYRQPQRPGYWHDGTTYYGLRVGPAFATVNSDDRYLDGSSMKTGLNVGVAMGVNFVREAPLFLETGLYYTEKGGRGHADGTRFTYSLNYVELPLLLKYKYHVDRSLSIEPFLGGYVACGVGGKIRDFGQREAYSSFSSSPYSFERFDGGLRMGCGLSYDLLYAELGYDLGLANISHDDFDTSHTGALMLTVGLNF